MSFLKRSKRVRFVFYVSHACFSRCASPCHSLFLFCLAILSPRPSYSALINVVVCPPNNYPAFWRIHSSRPDRSRPSFAWRSCQMHYRSRRCSSLRTDRKPIGRSRRNYLTVGSSQVACNIKHMWRICEYLIFNK